VTNQAHIRSIAFRIAALVLRTGLVAALVGAGWLVYREMPGSGPVETASPAAIQIVLLPPPDLEAAPRDIPVEISPIDSVAVRHEYFLEPRAGQRFEEFQRDRMKGKQPIEIRLDPQGRGTANVPPGTWWLHAVLSGDVDLEWRMQINVTRNPQTIELTPQNAIRSRSF
jgi:hypothetical protein